MTAKENMDLNTIFHVKDDGRKNIQSISLKPVPCILIISTEVSGFR